LGTAVYVLSSGTATLSSPTYTTSTQDQSGICVTNYGTSLTVTNPTITTSGNTSSADNSSFYGLNAGVLAYGSSSSTNTGGAITITGGTITTTGTGGNGIFASGKGSSITITDTVISASASNGHGIEAAMGGTITATNITATSKGAAGSIIATDRGGGTITVSGGTFKAYGSKSAGVYATDVITISGATIISYGAEAVVLEGASKVTITNTALTGAVGDNDRGMLLYQSTSGDASEGSSSITITGGSYTWPSTTGPAFYNTNQTTSVTLTNVTINNSSSTLITAEANSNWGTSGSNGGVLTFNASGETLTGSVVVDSISTVAISLSNSSTLQGAINNAKTAKSVSLTLDSSSSWTVTGTSYLTVLSDTAGVSGTSVSNIIGNGYNVYYLSSSNSWLGGVTYSLSGGGSLIPY